MARNGSGTYNRAVSPYQAGTVITAATINSEMDDIATALTGSMARDGQSPATANIPMGGFRITGLANGVASTDAAALGQVVAKAGDTMTGALNFAPEVDLASAGTTDIGAQASNNVRITGTTTITSFGTAANGVTRELRFAAALTLTNSGSLILPGGANITTAAGDTATAKSLGSGNWVVTDYQRALSFGITRGAAQATTGNVAFDFTGIPAGVRRVTALLSGVSTNGGSSLALRLGTSGGFVTSGYAGLFGYWSNISQSYAATSSGFFLINGGASDVTYGRFVFENITGNSWIGTFSGFVSNGVNSWVSYCAAEIALGGVLDRLRLTTDAGTPTFDAGTFNIMWEF